MSGQWGGRRTPINQLAGLYTRLCGNQQYKKQNQGILHAYVQTPREIWRLPDRKGDDCISTGVHRIFTIARYEVGHSSFVFPETGLCPPRCLLERPH